MSLNLNSKSIKNQSKLRKSNMKCCKLQYFSHELLQIVIWFAINCYKFKPSESDPVLTIDSEAPRQAVVHIWSSSDEQYRCGFLACYSML